MLFIQSSFPPLRDILKLLLPKTASLKLSHFYGLLMEKAMTPHFSTLSWKIPWMEEPGRLQSMGLLRVRYYWATSLSFFTFMHWRRKWQPTPVFLPENPRDGGTWWASISGVAQSRTRLKQLSRQQNGLLMGFPGDASGKEPACQSRRHMRHGFNLYIWKIPRRREWQSTPVFLFGESESHGQRSLLGYSP